MIEFEKDKITSESGFWIMYYFLKNHYDLSKGSFDISDILSTCQPLRLGDSDPTDSGMIVNWNDALAEFKQKGIPEPKIK